MENVRNYSISFAVFLLIDFIWLGFIAKSLYSKYLGYIMAPKPNLVVALIFYALFTLGILVFVIKPALLAQEPMRALLYGMFFGLITYATYDLTNLATLKDWPITITIIDLIWGTFLGGTTSYISYMLITTLFK
ncbi:MAG: DUF2177 family protein [Erysipelotrichaceae bacterium]|nr:DUF2177 family protein [Erysipelotrichaceae bacterium]MDD3924727.1 DUF2177 family protein [Erysipelotrichaceae bacterium]MDD4642764.1 DUF2177 family protein [Erysipelotrichaceae bacterium]